MLLLTDTVGAADMPALRTQMGFVADRFGRARTWHVGMLLELLAVHAARCSRFALLAVHAARCSRCSLFTLLAACGRWSGWCSLSAPGCL